MSIPSTTSTTSTTTATITTKPGVSLLHVAGQVGTTTTKDGLLPAPADYESQVHLALLHLRQALLAAGATIPDIAKLTLYVVNKYDDDDPTTTTRKHVRHVERFLNGHRPASITLVPVPQLAHPAWLFEVDAAVVVAVEAPSSTSTPTQPPPLLPTPAPAPARAVSSPAAAAASKTFDVVIIGAGLAGLTAAEALHRAGLSCVVLEARDRVGGKTWSTPLSSSGSHGGNGDSGAAAAPVVVDVGAAWINDSNQSRMIALARRFGAELTVQNTTGQCALQDFEGHCSAFPYGELPRFDEATLQNVATVRDTTEAHCQALDPWNPSHDPSSLDALTLEAYLVTRLGAGPTALATATLWTRAMLGQEPADLSALFFLHYCRSGGGLLQMRSDRKHGGQYLRVRQGTQLFAHGLAGALPRDVVRLETPVTGITSVGNDDDDSNSSSSSWMQVTTATGEVYTARKVITSVPSPVLKTIAFCPPLPPAKRLLVESATYGYYTKAMLVFRTPFWVRHGFCGLTQSFTGPASIVRDTSSPPDDKHVLTCFLVGGPGRAWAQLPSDEARTQALLAQLAALFGVDLDTTVRALFVDMVRYEWTGDEWAGWGCPCTSLPPGVLAAVGSHALRDPVGNVHFVGTETAAEWKGYMEGAVRSGERGAAEVIAQLKGASAKL